MAAVDAASLPLQQEESNGSKHLVVDRPRTPLSPLVDAGFRTPTTPTMHIETALETSPYSESDNLEWTTNNEIVTPTAEESPLTPNTPEREVSRGAGENDPKQQQEEAHLSMASMASIPLSESSLDYDHLSAEQIQECLTTPKASESTHPRRPSSLEILQNPWKLTRKDTLFDSARESDGGSFHSFHSDSGSNSADSSPQEPSSRASGIRRKSTRVTYTLKVRDAAGDGAAYSNAATRGQTRSGSGDELEVNWLQLERDEQQEKDDKSLPEGAEDESTKFLLARLEQENALLASDPKTHANAATARLRSESPSRPPSIAQLKKLVDDKDSPAIRYSLAPNIVPTREDVSGMEEVPPPMTELEFWAALVQDYPSTASRLPTLTTSKIRAGIPPPLRGVVWTTMSGARDRRLEAAFDKLIHEKSPYEGIINKDVGRSFPGVELFRDAEGEGQKMLGRVLKCFSLHDKDIGYCQGLGFLVGPLLMNMGERDAFCVLVRLMDNFALRPSFLPSLSGLHMRIFQFSNLLRQHHPQLAAHLAELGVEPAYLSQWFLSCFAVTCPLPMLFRIYDVIFAEGANETVMRVALALMRRNEEKMLATTEFEEVMQLLLGRGIWDVYGFSADDLVDDFTSLGKAISHERLGELQREFENQSGEDVGKSAGFLPDVQAAASRFLGRLWAPSHGSSKSTSTLSPPNADHRPGSFLRRSASKQSISTINDSDGTSSSSSGSASLASTAPTEADSIEGAVRESAAYTSSLKSKAGMSRTPSISIHSSTTPVGFATAKEQQELHVQIEDLLTALSELQREHAQLTAMLQKEREDRSEDHRVVQQLVSRLDIDSSKQTVQLKEDRRRTLPPPPRAIVSRERPKSLQLELNENVRGKAGERQQGGDVELTGLVESVQARLQSSTRISASFETKAQIRSALARAREELGREQSRSRELAQQVDSAMQSLTTFELETADLRDQVADLRVRVNDEFNLRQKLERTVKDLRAEARRLAEAPRLDAGQLQRKRTSSVSSSGALTPTGLRELKLGRRDSSSSVTSVRSSRLQRAPEVPLASKDYRPPSPGNAPISIPLVPFTQASSNAGEAPESAGATSPSPSSAKGNPPATPRSTHQAKVSLSVPTNTSDKERAAVWGQRTSSLATQQVLATPANEPAHEDALLVELVAAKTAEAMARQEVDEMKRSMNMAKRQHEATIARMQQQMRAAISEAHAAAAVAKAEAAVAKSMVESMGSLAMANEDGGLARTPTSKTGTPTGTPILETPPAVPEIKVDKSTPASGGGWFWNRRNPSASALPATSSG